MIDPDAIQARLDALEQFLDERDRRLSLRVKPRAARRHSRGSRTTGMARSTIGGRLADLDRGRTLQ